MQNVMAGSKVVVTCLVLLTGKDAVTVSKKIVEINGSRVLETTLMVLVGPVLILSCCC